MTTYDYAKVHDRLVCRGEDLVPPKEAAIRLGVSERVIRKAAAEGMNDVTADLLCTRGLGLHPAICYGLDGWIGEDEAFLDLLEDLALASERPKPKRRRRVA